MHRCTVFVQSQRDITIYPAMFSMLNNEPYLMSVLLFWVHCLTIWYSAIFSCWAVPWLTLCFCSQILGGTEKSKWFHSVVCLAGFVKPIFKGVCLHLHVLLSLLDWETIKFPLFISYSIKSWTVFLKDLKDWLTCWGVACPLPLSASLSAPGPVNMSACTFGLMILNSD